MPQTSWSYRRELDLLDELCHIGQSEDINLINLQQVPVTLQMRVLETGRPLYVRDEIRLADFKEWVIRRYCDFEPDLKNLYRDFDAGLREEFL
ncbi:MAG: nucleotidyltransferase domain-containing protein [Firmicutes bacterium]|nr:nucleotidyltransferase domain-containing protein [Bacillota bacterium]